MTIQYLSDKTVASRYDVSRPTIWRWTRNNKFPKPVKLNNGSTRWFLPDLEKWEKGQHREGGRK